MAVSFLTAAQRDRYGRYPDVVTPNDLSRCFHLSDDDRAQIMSCRGHHNRLGFALQLSTVRYLGTFLDDPIAVPSSVLQSLSHQLDIHTLDGLQSYRKGEQREEHVTKIRKRYGYGDITEPRVGFRMARWLYGVCWTGTERLGALFDRATAWLLAHKILLPGVTTLERFVVSVRVRVEVRLYQLLTRGDHPATERPVATAAARAGGRSGFFARPDSLGADAHQRSVDSRSDRSIERRACAGYHRTDEGPHSVEPDRVLGALRQPRKGSGHQPHANGTPDRDARGLRPLSRSHRTGRGAGSVGDAIARLVRQGDHG